MKTFAKLKQFLSLNKDFFLKIKKYSLTADADGINPKKFWFYAESLGEFRLALYIIDIIKSVLSEKKEINPVFFISFKTRSTLSLAKKNLAKKSLVRKNNEILYFFHPVLGLKYILKRYVSAVKPDYFISVQHPVSKNLIKELLNINAKLIFSGISASDFKKMHINYQESKTEASAPPGSLINPVIPAKEETGRPYFLSATVSGFPSAMSVKFNTMPLSLKFISCLSLDNGSTVKSSAAGEVGAGKENNIVISFVSVHKKESDFILNLIKELISDTSLKDFNLNLKFIFAPRNIKNSPELFKTSSKIGLHTAYYDGNIADFLKKGGIKSLIVAQYGVLGDIYPVSDIVYVGKSLFKKEKGGHNILEPALYGKSVITGAYSTNFNDIVQEMLKFNAITEVAERNFKQTLINLIKNKDLRMEIGKNGLNFCIRKRDEFKTYFKNYLTENII
ncbi:MAG: 3-deoxy-D-manno-octulosonic acid transferase [bacterium]